VVKKDIYQDVTNQIINALENGTAPWRKSWACNGAGDPLRHNGVPYKGINWLLLQLSPWGAAHWLTYKQAQAEGGQVRKGEKGSPVVFFKKITVEDKSTGEDVQIPMLRHYTVFNAEQIDGLPEKYYPRPIERNPDDTCAATEKLIAETGAEMRHGGDSAYYSPGQDFVQMPHFAAFDSAVAYYGTALHELTHWTGHEKRLDRNIKNAFGSKDYAREELVAEIGAAMLCSALGLENTVREDHSSYIDGWLKVLREDKRAIFKAAAMAQRAADYLSGNLAEKTEAETEAA